MAQETAGDVWTVSRLLKWTTGWLQQHEVDSPRLSAELLLAHALQCRKIELYTRFEAVPGADVLAAFREFVKKAADHVPIAYLIARKEFFSIEFEVTPAVLIPRPETETLVQKAIDLCRADKDRPMSILDLGTGSGCIAISIARYVPTASLTASDVSEEAIAVASRNAERSGVAERIRFVVADGLALPADAVPEGGFDMIVSNPPYIAEPQFEQLDRNVREHEPRISLCGGPDGLDFYRLLATQAEAKLKPGGSILVEIGAGQRDDVVKVFGSDDRFIHRGTYRDPADPHDRVVHVQGRAG
jgi:release factor glutamine methyltransferase